VKISAQPLSGSDLTAWRERYREEARGQIVHDSLHRREGWTASHELLVGGAAVGYGSTALAGPWAGRPTVFEFYVLPDRRVQAFGLFEAYLEASGSHHFEVQTNDILLTNMVHAYGRGVESEKIVFDDRVRTALPSGGALLVRDSDEFADRAAVGQRQGGSKWQLTIEGAVVGTGGVLFHYNQPYGDVYMEIVEGFRRKGFGSYFVQELKRATYDLGQVPCARCNTANVASRQTLQRAGFAPCGHILVGSLVR
jgi:GNAT superfamily N-acetyltransferase